MIQYNNNLEYIFKKRYRTSLRNLGFKRSRSKVSIDNDVNISHISHLAPISQSPSADYITQQAA